jgi:hypothetical protein
MTNSAVELGQGLVASLDPIEPALQCLEPALQVAALDQIGDQTQDAHKPGRVERVALAIERFAVEARGLAPDAPGAGELHGSSSWSLRLRLFRLFRQDFVPLWEASGGNDRRSLSSKQVG